MRNISSAFKEQQNDGNRNYLKYVDLTLADGTVLNLDNSNFWSYGFRFEDSVSSSDNFDIGSAIINQFSISLNNISDEFSDYVFDGANAVAYVALKIGDVIEKIRICTATVTDSPYQNSSIINLTCQDNMLKFDRDYSEVKTVFPATRGKIVRDICSVCGVTLQTTTFQGDDYIVQTRPDEEALTCRQMLAWVAQIGCQWCRCDAYGRLCVGWYNTNAMDDEIINLPSTTGLTVNLEDVVITGVRVSEYDEQTGEESEAKTYLYGSEGYVLEISDNKLIIIGAGQTIASMIGQRCVGMRFRPFSASCLTDVSMEAGDAVKIVDRKGNTYKSYLTSVILNPGNFESVECAAKSAERNSAKRYSLLTQVQVDARKSVQKEKSEREKALEELGERINNSQGAFTTIEEQSDGSKVYYLHNKPNLEDSEMIWKMTVEAWGVSTDGGETWNAGMTVDGDTIVRILRATGVNADWINTGRIEVRDENDKILFLVDMDTKQVVIDGDHLRIGEQPLSQLIMDTKTIVLSMDNYYQAIGVDKDGNYETFPTVTVKPTVHYGLDDITGDCFFAVTESDNVTGIWDNQTKTYTVTGLTADTGWVDFTATYLGRFMDIKRFNLAKIYAGEEGPPGVNGRSYILKKSPEFVKRLQGLKYDKDYITFSAYYMDGDEAVRKPYSGRFKLYEYYLSDTSPARIWTLSSDCDEIRHILNTVIIDGDGSTLVNEKNEIITTQRITAKVRAELYAPGGNTQLIDMEDVTFIDTLDTLSHEDIFNLLTDNGKIKGIFKEGNQLYVNATYIVTGILADVQKRNYWNMETGEFRLAATATVGGKTVDAIASEKATSAVNGQTQKDIFNKLTNNGQTQGIFLKDGLLYLNASYIKGGTIEGIDLISKAGQEWFKISESLATGGYGDDMDGLLDLSAQYPNDIRNVVLEARNFDLIFKAPQGKQIIFESGTPIFNKPPQLLGLSTVTSGGHIVFASDGKTLAHLASSSERYKSYVADVRIEEAEKLLDIPVVWFKYKDGYLNENDGLYGKPLPGLYAEDVFAALKEAARIDQDGKPEDWNYRVLIPIMLKLIQNLYQKGEKNDGNI